MCFWNSSIKLFKFLLLTCYIVNHFASILLINQAHSSDQNKTTRTPKLLTSCPPAEGESLQGHCNFFQLNKLIGFHRVIMRPLAASRSEYLSCYRDHPTVMFTLTQPDPFQSQVDSLHAFCNSINYNLKFVRLGAAECKECLLILEL